MTWAEILRVVAVALAFVMPAAFCICYHLWTRGHWRDTRYGVHLMVVSGVDALIVLYVLLAMLDAVPVSWRPVSGFVIYLSFAGTFLWRLILLAHDHRKVRRQARRAG